MTRDPYLASHWRATKSEGPCEGSTKRVSLPSCERATTSVSFNQFDT